MDTIFALASGRGRAGVSVVRISGPAAFTVLSKLTDTVKPRVASLRSLTHNDELLDEALVLTFPGPGSFTGEDVVELHLHGSIATVDAMLKCLGEMPELRPAEAGEFTRRALLNERLDIAQVEGLSDLIEAETEAQRRQALRVLTGDLGRKAFEWREKLIRAAALLEATIDFVDEEVPVDVMPEVEALLSSVLGDLSREVTGAKAAERIREGFEVAIIGPPNVGKSSLLNALAGREAAITSSIAGTTRDVIEVRMDIRGLPVTFLDTAGIRESSDAIEVLGIERALQRAEDADLRIVLSNDQSETVVTPREDDVFLVTKSDVRSGDISANTGEGMDALVEQIADLLEARSATVGVAIRERHRLAIAAAVPSLEKALGRVSDASELPELVSEEIRFAVGSLDSLVGRVGVEDVLDEIFCSFCIGK
ncbi:MAG: tRNA uridine-5-carboxymethylaminomethyl(34) synthesis GTPase MnmE [Pseudomonadota bacterium]